MSRQFILYTFSSVADPQKSCTYTVHELTPQSLPYIHALPTFPSISNYCGILDGKCPSQVFDHNLVIFSFLYKPVEYSPSVVSLQMSLFLGYLENGGRKLL
jgi:hypothetical protein